jgi:hypothetical protein
MPVSSFSAYINARIKAGSLDKTGPEAAGHGALGGTAAQHQCFRLGNTLIPKHVQRSCKQCFAKP